MLFVEKDAYIFFLREYMAGRRTRFELRQLEHELLNGEATKKELRKLKKCIVSLEYTFGVDVTMGHGKHHSLSMI